MGSQRVGVNSSSVLWVDRLKNLIAILSIRKSFLAQSFEHNQNPTTFHHPHYLFIQSHCVCVLVAHLCPTLCNPIDSSLPGSYVYGILQARILEWVAIPISRVSSRPRDQTQVFCIAGRLLSHQGRTYHLLDTQFPYISACSSHFHRRVG